jgi:transposase InsO family protein
MRGRRPVGPEYVEKLQGSALAKERARTVLETLSGELRLQEACERLDICEQRFHQVRQEALQATVAALEPGVPGRPTPAPTPAEEQLRALQARVSQLELELRAAKAREEIALILPRLVHKDTGPVLPDAAAELGHPADAPKKKTPAHVAPVAATPIATAPAAWTEEQHVKRLSDLCQPAIPAPPALPPAPQPGLAPRRFSQRGRHQRPQRLREHILRSNLVDFQLWTKQQGLTLPQTAGLLHLSERTLRQWHYDLRTGLFHVQPLGRPLLRACRQDRNAVIELLDELGPATSVATLQVCCPDMARAELTELLKRYRRVWQQRHLQDQFLLRWPVPGAVWAMDFTEPPRPIDGLYPYLLAVRDLASGQQLLWLPLTNADAEHTIAALLPLLLLWGAPLVLKSDNGSPFCAAATREFLDAWSVITLFSPPYTPEYNGSAEAGIGSLKTRTEAYATANGRPTSWTHHDTAAAQAQANATSRPRGQQAQTADQLWQRRPKLTPGQRAAFRAAVAQQRDAVRRDEGWPLVGPLTDRATRALDRQAIRRALVEHGFLVFRRRRIPLPFPKPISADIR